MVLLGDLFDAWIEYRDLIPKGLTRLLGLLAEMSDAGREVLVCVGNHDPWHRDYMERELGFEVLRASQVRTWHGRRVRFGHGDQEGAGGLSLWHRFIRHPWVHRLYAEVLPGSAGLSLARRWSRALKDDLEPEAIASLRASAQADLAADRADLVVYGHVHHPEHSGDYINTGSWALTRTYAMLDGQGARLLTWEPQNS